ncbi:MAG: hypothetical protein KME07_09975 [Pegethrix bostrychoides GSE-TBD4-15B]|uniref:Uncharacterized protein n=1 Tax=Pegethrix bostrychoides GSE-TBD4-15B TaxID=2839662 RepID=A0A951U4K4_9CYAN|nr:hypothetical protein [Pegethrix bostrychoides GSE-TBD4-15B]
MRSFSHTSQAAQPAQPASPSPNPSSFNTAMGCCLLLLPIVLCLSVTAHRKHRIAKLRRQVQMLEKLWLLNAPKTLP